MAKRDYRQSEIDALCKAEETYCIWGTYSPTFAQMQEGPPPYQQVEIDDQVTRRVRADMAAGKLASDLYIEGMKKRAAIEGREHRPADIPRQLSMDPESQYYQESAREWGWLLQITLDGKKVDPISYDLDRGFVLLPIRNGEGLIERDKEGRVPKEVRIGNVEARWLDDEQSDA